MKSRSCAIFILVFFLPSGGCNVSQQSNSKTDDRIYVGILENIPDPQTGTPGFNARVVFQGAGQNWTAMPNNPSNQEELTSMSEGYPYSVEWTVVLRGKKIGELSSKETGNASYANLGVQDIITKRADIPEVKMDASEFDYWTGKSKTRPLILVSGSHFTDTEGWKDTEITSEEKQFLISQFQKMVPTMTFCESAYDNKASQVAYRKVAIQFSKAHRSRSGILLAGVGLKPDLFKCDGPMSDEFTEHWFVLSENRKATFLGKRVHPIGSADLDSDGIAEWIFKTSGYNEDGYVLFYGNFSKSTVFKWSYH